MFLINRTHESCSRRKNFIDENEYCFFRSKFDAFTNDVAELSDRQVRWNEIFLLIDYRNIRFLNFLTNYLTIHALELNPKKVGERRGGTGIRSVYFCLIRSASAFLFSKGCSSLNLDFAILIKSERGTVIRFSGDQYVVARIR